MESVDSNLPAVTTRVENKALSEKGKPREDRSVKCPVCDEKFKFGFSTSKIWHHLRKDHLIEKYNFLCYVCAQMFPHLKLLNTHQKVHANGATHKCLICGQKTTSVGDLKAHMVKRHRNYKRRFVDCQLCRRYIRNTNFHEHLQKHVESPQDEVQHSPPQRTKKESTEPLGNIPKALNARYTQPVVEAEVGQIENPKMSVRNNHTSVVNSSPAFGNYEQFGKKSTSILTSLVDANGSQTTLMPGATTVWEYALTINDAVLVISPYGVWLEWILIVPEVPLSNN